MWLVRNEDDIVGSALRIKVFICAQAKISSSLSRSNHPDTNTEQSRGIPDQKDWAGQRPGDRPLQSQARGLVHTIHPRFSPCATDHFLRTKITTLILTRRHVGHAEGLLSEKKETISRRTLHYECKLKRPQYLLTPRSFSRWWEHKSGLKQSLVSAFHLSPCHIKQLKSDL